MCAAIHHSHPQAPVCHQRNVCGLPSTTNVNHPPSPSLPASQHPQHGPDVLAPNHLAASTTQGIRVRDFAYENTLPPVTTVPRFPVQIQPRLRTLKRTRDMVEGHDAREESDEEDPAIPRTFYIDSNGTGVSHGYRYRKKPVTLGRTLTEPADEVMPSQGFNTRAQVFTQPSSRPASPPAQLHNVQSPTTPQRPIRFLASTIYSPNARALSPICTVPQSQPSLHGKSQESDLWVDTPLVTPNGSLQRPTHNAIALPASQFEFEPVSVLPQLPDLDGDVTMSQLGFTPERSQRPYTQPVPFPAGTPSTSRSQHAQMPPPAKFHPHLRTPSPTKPRRPSGSPVRRSSRSRASPSPMQETPASRYDLRQRPPTAKPTASRATSRVRASSQAARHTDMHKPAPSSKKRKVTPPMAGARGRKKNGDAKDNE